MIPPILELFERQTVRPKQALGSFKEYGPLYDTEGGLSSHIVRVNGNDTVRSCNTRKVEGVHIPLTQLPGYPKEKLDHLARIAWAMTASLAEHMLHSTTEPEPIEVRAPDPDSVLLDFTRTLKGANVLHTSSEKDLRLPVVMEVTPQRPIGVWLSENSDFQGPMGLLFLGSRVKCVQVYSLSEWDEILDV